MNLNLTPAQEEKRRAFAAYARTHIAPRAETFDREERLPNEVLEGLARQGYLGATLPPVYGGAGMDMLTFGLLNEELGRVCAATRALVMVQNMVGQAILRWGSEAQKSRWLPQLASGETIAAIAVTEPEVGSDARHVTAALAPTGDAHSLRGRKKWISFGQVADLFLVLAQLDGKPTAVLLERTAPGLTITPITGMLGMRAAMLAELRLDDCPVPPQNVVGGPGFGLSPVVLTALNVGRYGIAWGCVGMAQACLDASLAHAAARKQFDARLKDHQLIRRMIADMVVQVKAARLLCHRAGQLWATDRQAAIAETMAAKYFAASMAVRVAGDAVRIHGAAGCHSKCPVQRHWRDAKIMEIIEGTTEIHQLQIASFAFRESTAADPQSPNLQSPVSHLPSR